ncbi:MAG: acyl-CoA synthetase [Chloroflexi bacterium]|nr:acyl-CoA synthetase [Chloroflexota bacterium]
MAGIFISGTRELTGEQLFERSARAATGLGQLGVGAGDAVAILLRNDFPFIEATIATQALNAYAVPVNWHTNWDEIGAIMADCKAKVLLSHTDLLVPIARQVPAEITILAVPTPDEIRTAYELDPAVCRLSEGATDWTRWLEGFEPHPGTPEPARFNFLNTMIYTGGTTGRPKGIRRLPISEEQEQAMFQALTQDAETVQLITGPLYHNAPNMNCLRGVSCQSTIILMPRFSPEETLRMIAKHNVSFLHAVPTMFNRLLKLPDAVKQRYDLSSLEVVVHGAAPCAPEVKRAMIDWWGPVLVEYYGGSETGAVTLCDSNEWLGHPGTVGMPLENTDVRIFDDEGRRVGPGEIGEIYMWNGSQPDFTYLGKAEMRREVEREGLVTCGDIGYMDEDGFLYLCDRKNDMVISAGVNIYPSEIEAALHGLPGVRDCAVFGIPDEDFGESLAAAIQLEDGANLTSDAVIKYLKGKLAGFKVPRLIQFHSDLPREDSGKIFKRKLREPYWQKAERSI